MPGTYASPLKAGPKLCYSLEAMAKKKLGTRKAAERLAAIAEKHLSKLAPAEQDARIRAFHKVVSTVRDSHAKREEHPQTRERRPVGQAPAMRA